MKTSKKWMGYCVPWLWLAMAMACSLGPTSDPTVGSESHFLSICGTDSDCPPDLACTCGICTLECSDDDTCTARGQSRCVASADLAATCAESASLSEGICVAKCTNDAQCQAITPGTACTPDGWCEPQRWGFNPEPEGGDTGGTGDTGPSPIFGEGGVPGRVYIYVGRTENRLYFRVSQTLEGTVAYYELGRGWSVDPVLTGIAAANAGRWNIDEPATIVMADTTRYLFFADRIFRSEDQGVSWQALEGLPPMFKIRSFGVDQDRLFLLTTDLNASNYVLWRSPDAGLSWEMLGDFSSDTQLAVLPGLVIRLPEGHFSIDQGQTWQTHATCQNLASSAGRWYVFGERFLFVSSEGVLAEFDPLEGCSPRFPSGSGAAQIASVGELLVLEDRILGVTSTGAVVRISRDLSSAELVSLAEPLRPMAPGRSILDLGDAGLAFLTNRGLMVSADDLQNSNFIGHHYSSPHWFVEKDGVVYTPGDDGVYGYEQGRWTRSERFSSTLNARDWLNGLRQRSGRIFATRSGPTSLYEFLDGADAPTLVWEHPQPSEGTFSEHGETGADPAFVSEVHVHEGRLFVASNRLFLGLPDYPEEPEDWWEQVYATVYQDALVPGSPLSADFLELEAEGGGVFVSDLTGTNFELFGQGFLDPQTGHVPTVVAMAIFENHIYGATSLRGVWRANLVEGQWTPAHDGLPTAADGEGALPVLGLYATAEGLFATTTDAVYLLDGEAWRLVVDGFQGPVVNSGYGRVGLISIMLVDGRLLAVSWDGIYELDLAQGGRSLYWAPSNHLIRHAAHLSSGLYVGLHAGGVQIVGE